MWLAGAEGPRASRPGSSVVPGSPPRTALSKEAFPRKGAVGHHRPPQPASVTGAQDPDIRWPEPPAARADGCV